MTYHDQPVPLLLISPTRLRPQSDKGDFGIYTTAPIPAGSLLLLFTGDIVDAEQLQQVPASHRRFSIQVEEGLYLVTLGDPKPQTISTTRVYLRPA